MRCSKDAHYFAFGPEGPCQCLKFLSAPDTHPQPVRVPEPVNRDQDRPRHSGLLTQQILASVTEPKTSADVAKELDYSVTRIRLMLCKLRRHGRVRLVQKVGRIAFYTRVTNLSESAHTVN